MNDHRVVPDGLEDYFTSDADYFSLLQLDCDPKAQLAAINLLLDRNKASDDQLSSQIQTASEFDHRQSTEWSEAQESHYIDLCHDSVYQDAAHSMAAVGMLAPFLETILHQAFLALEKHFKQQLVAIQDHPRLQTQHKNQWDCHYVLNEKGKYTKDINLGAQQIAAAVGLAPLLPDDFWKVFHALISYRNKMLHNAMEWPKSERSKFLKAVTDNAWPESWFPKSTSAGEPWAIYMSPELIERCTGATCEIRTAFGKLARELYSLKPTGEIFNS